VRLPAKVSEFFIGDAGEDVQVANGITKSIALRKGREVLAVFHLRDTIREEAREVIDGVKKLGLTPVLLSGDRQEATRAVAQVTPEEKKKVIEDLQRKGHTVAMVGDGINDAPAWGTGSTMPPLLLRLICPLRFLRVSI